MVQLTAGKTSSHSQAQPEACEALKQLTSPPPCPSYCSSWLAHARRAICFFTILGQHTRNMLLYGSWLAHAQYVSLRFLASTHAICLFTILGQHTRNMSLYDSWLAHAQYVSLQFLLAHLQYVSFYSAIHCGEQ